MGAVNTGTLTPFETVNWQARPYPSYFLPKGGTGLAIFSAAFLGCNDVIHLARAEMTVDCVDVNKERLWEMAAIYPAGWSFHVEDAWEFAERQTGKWDAVTVDPFFEDCAQKAWASLDLWLALADQMLTLTVHADTELDTPNGWTQSYFPRGEDVGWAVFRRA